MDKNDFKLAMAKRRIESLEAELEKVRATKRRKVEINLNMQFMSIETIRASQRAAGRKPVEDSDSEKEDDSSNVLSCIYVL